MALGEWSALILAAGGSRRFGSPKMLAAFHGAPVIRRTTETIVSAGFGETIIVAGGESVAIAEALSGLCCTVVQAAAWEGGIAESIRAGIGARQMIGRGLFVFLGDMPVIPVSICQKLAALAESSGFASRPIVKGKPGHPVCFASDAVGALASLHGDQGAVHILKDREAAYLEIDDTGAICDVDTPSDLAAAERLWNTRLTSATIDSAMSAGDLPKP